MLHTYKYAAQSQLLQEPRAKLILATADTGGERYPYFFEGRVLQPRLIADLLTAVHIIVGTRFYTPPGMNGRPMTLSDPVVTSGGGVLRFEGFSSCCGAYIRADMLPESYDGEVTGKGTTNIDFNSPMRAALDKVRDAGGLALAVGSNEFTIRSASGQATERKVELPNRWLRGMVEVQSQQAGMKRRFEVSGVDALRLFRGLPKSRTSRLSLWIARGPSGLYSTTRPVERGVRVMDTTRLRVLETLLPHCESLSAYADDAQQASAWVLDFGVARLTLSLTAEPWRGFSGEGQALSAMMQADDSAVSAVLTRVRAQLQWQAALDVNVLAREMNVATHVVSDALRIIGASGLAGYDVLGGHYFHRVLPFDLSMLEDLHPRLKDAKSILLGEGVKVLRQRPFEAEVKSGDIPHHVREVDHELRCTCAWFAKHQGERGPCKHVLAAATLRHATR
ncbi:SWIM zinc finger family protein [Steroidobacter sp. S1-65]|uniref:SWIM zinc finger family protein n=1 Tax=Steroidobacter gossypii TaxID=2805490 RepID=A0ABS1X093_9GAMM|nr:SWIM zinc finger family protein [Steroidobacter gossypii]MBM0106658.1 SWIM zinc finger family protein [Steroidobacter gossypii]